MATTLILFVSTFVLVFALGFQSLNVNGGHEKTAAATSLVIGSTQMIALQLGHNANWLETIGYLSGGPLGIVCSMRFHRYLFRHKSHQQKGDALTLLHSDIVDANRYRYLLKHAKWVVDHNNLGHWEFPQLHGMNKPAINDCIDQNIKANAAAETSD
ncbi:MAG TPA: hypothetical protein VM532_12770 [Burkholderiales bacterium]|jgi:hypothetical protein|nr:hypothetical protein [Burkholderiales bacterium]